LEETSLNTVPYFKRIFCYFFFDFLNFNIIFVAMSDNDFKDNSDKSKSVIKDEIGKNDI